MSREADWSKWRKLECFVYKNRIFSMNGDRRGHGNQDAMAGGPSESVWRTPKNPVPLHLHQCSIAVTERWFLCTFDFYALRDVAVMSRHSQSRSSLPTKGVDALGAGSSLAAGSREQPACKQNRVPPDRAQFRHETVEEE